MKPTQVKWWAKCLGFTLSVDVLLGVVMFLYARDIVTDKQSFVLAIAVCLAAAPTYFFVKGNASLTPLYIAVTAVSHVAWVAAIILGLSKIFTGWERVMFEFAGSLSTLMFAIVFLMDAGICVWRRISKIIVLHKS